MTTGKYTIWLSNYRCFSREKPAEFTIGDGITAIVGRNNSGKSALLRFFYEFREVIGSLNRMPGGPAHKLNPPQPVRDAEEFFCKANEGDMAFQIDVPYHGEVGIGRGSQSVLAICRRKTKTLHIDQLNTFDQQYLKRASGDPVCQIDGQPVVHLEQLFLGLQPLTQACYIPAYRNASSNPEGHSFDFMGNESFIERWNGARNGGQTALRERMRRVEKDVGRLIGCQNFQTRKPTGANALVLEIDGQEYYLDEVGCGISQLLMLLGTVALRKPSFLLIDEPELNLHPSLQLDLITTLARLVNGNLVFSTHNVGLARAAATRIYAINALGPGSSTVHPLEDHPTLAQFLGELQYGAFSQIGGNRVLLVEGAGDVPVFQQFLRKFGKDHEVIILPLGGNTLIRAESASQLNEIKRICPNIAVIIDSEKQTEGSPLAPTRQAFVDNCKELRFETHVMQRRAIEHYLPDRALKAAFGPNASELRPFGSITLTGGWTKATNWLAAAEMTREELLATDVGKFLSEWLRDSK